MSPATKVVRIIALMVAFVLVAGTGGALAAGMVAPTLAGVANITSGSIAMFNSISDDGFPDIVPSQESTLRMSDGTLLAKFFATSRIVVGGDKISDNIRHAVVSVEDKRFYEHGGIDVRGMIRAVVNNANDEAVQGASTLTQQYVKNTLLEDAIQNDDKAAQRAATEKSTERKLREAKLALALEKRMTKDEILNGYLNIAQFGIGQYGVEAASQHYFSKPASDLSIAEAALLAGVTKNPTMYDPVRNPDASQKRRDVVLGTMLASGYITQAEHDEAVAIPVASMLNVTKTANGCSSTQIYAYFCEYAVTSIKNDPAFGATPQERQNLLLRGGIDVTTTIDPTLQEAAHAEVIATVPVDDPSGVDSALVSVQPGTGHVLAMTQNTEYKLPTVDNPNLGRGQTTMNYSADQKYGGSGGFQIGSTAKVFVLTAWLLDGRTLNETVDATARKWKAKDFTMTCAPRVKDSKGNFIDGPGDWGPKNAEVQASGPMSIMTATKESVNTAYAAMTQQLDLCAIEKASEALGFHRADGTPTTINPSATLGTNESSPVTMASAYATLAAEGLRCDPIAIISWKDRDGVEHPGQNPNCQQTIPRDVALGAITAMKGVFTPGGTADKAKISAPSAGKTGTANEDMQSWFVGFTKNVSTAVWVGYAKAGNTEMQRITINGRYYRYVYGGVLAAPAWKDYMNSIAGTVAWGDPTDWDPASPQLVYGNQTAVPNVLGQSYDQAKATIEAAGFTVNFLQTGVYSDQPINTIAVQDPAGGSMQYKNATITLTGSMGPDPAAVTPPPVTPLPGTVPTTNPTQQPGGR